MDDYDPLEAFLSLNEAQKQEEDEKWNSQFNPSKMSAKRGIDEISLNPREQLLSGLQKPMEGNSFGMKMLQKMGYQQGEGLGKNGNGIKEPIQVKLKYDKLGIGHEEEQKKEQEAAEYERNLRIIRHQLDFNQMKMNYQNYIKEKYNIRQLSRDLRQAQQAIEILDEQHGVDANSLLLSRDEDCDVDVLSAHLSKMIDYLRKTYFYCIYCGCSYDSEKELSESCPGWDKDSHWFYCTIDLFVEQTIRVKPQQIQI